MPATKLPMLATAFAFITGLLMQFNQDIALPNWLAPLSLGGLLSVLVVLLPWIEKGSFAAIVMGYLLVALATINLAILFGLAHFPGQTVIGLSSRSTKAGLLLLQMVGIGLAVMLKASAWLVIGLMAMLVWGWHSQKEGDSRLGRQSQRQVPQKLLRGGVPLWEHSA
jgi:hypothetical protein